ncbi:MAG: fimbrial protein [Candidatus Cryptobacteroides sp.]
MRKTIHLIIAATAALIMTGCETLPHPAGCGETGTVTGITIKAGPSGSFVTRSQKPDEEKISDLNIFIFNGKGELEEFIFTDRIKTDGNGSAEVSAEWLTGKTCRIIACANFGFRMTGISSLDDIVPARYYMAYPDEYSRGIPMSGDSGPIVITERKEEIKVELERMMARVTLDIDRSALDKGVRFNVKSVRIGNSPKSASVFGSSRASGTSDIFTKGFFCSTEEADRLNIETSAGKSQSVDLYMLENMQGDLLPEAVSEKDKVLDLADAVSGLCSYIEIQAEYQSDEYCTPPDEYLVYRFYLGDSPANFDVERNCSYRITIKPDGTGISEDSWRIDKSCLTRLGPATLSIEPGNYIEGKVDDTIHIRAVVEPEDAKVVFGKEELDYDRERGIYDYSLDPDGRGVTLHLLSRGSGLLYVEAGNPTSDSALIILVVN